MHYATYYLAHTSGKRYAWLGAIALGFINALAFAPLDIFLGAWIALAGLYLLLLNSRSIRQAFCFGWLYSIALHATVIHWIWNSIALYSRLPLPIAGLLTVVVISIVALHMGIMASIFFYLQKRYLTTTAQLWCAPLLFAILITLQEWIQACHPFAIPIVFQGYTQWHLFSGIFAFVGTMGVSLIVAFLSALLMHSIATRSMRRLIVIGSGVMILCFWTTRNINWSSIQSDARQATMLQPNASLVNHWNPVHATKLFQKLQQISINHSDSDIIIWPENVVGLLYHQLKPRLLQLLNQLQQQGETALVVGSVRAKQQQRMTYTNSLIALSPAKTNTDIAISIYDKQNLVPFGEYIPASHLLYPILDLFGIRYSLISYSDTSPIAQFRLAGISWIPLICYDIDYPFFVQQQVSQVAQPSVLLAVSDEAWFGQSTAQALRLRTHQIRAREMGRWLLRVTGNGITATIDSLGRIQDQAPAFQSTTLTTKVYATTGDTPYKYLGVWSLLWLVLCLLALSLIVAASNNLLMRTKPFNQSYRRVS